MQSLACSSLFGVYAGVCFFSFTSGANEQSQGCGIKGFLPTSVIQGNPPLYEENSLWEALSVVSQKWPFPTALNKVHRKLAIAVFTLKLSFGTRWVCLAKQWWTFLLVPLNQAINQQATHKPTKSQSTKANKPTQPNPITNKHQCSPQQKVNQAKHTNKTSTTLETMKTPHTIQRFFPPKKKEDATARESLRSRESVQGPLWLASAEARLWPGAAGSFGPTGRKNARGGIDHRKSLWPLSY